MSRACSCPTDWGRLRRALHLSGREFGLIIHEARRTVWYHETTGPTHRCMLPAAQRHLLEYLQHSSQPGGLTRAAYLEAEGIAWPWPSLTPKPIRKTKPCPQCDQDLADHRRCLRCTFFIGPGHLPESRFPDVCTTCAHWMDTHPEHRRVGFGSAAELAAADSPQLPSQAEGRPSPARGERVMAAAGA